MSEWNDEEWDTLISQEAALEYRKSQMLRVHAYDDRRSNNPIDWESVLSGTLPEREYLAGDLFEAGQQVSLIGEGKVGKSILALDLVRALASGKPFLGAPRRPSVHVGYFDMENDLRTLAERAISLGMTADDFRNITYLSFPSLAPLDTVIGGEMLMEEVEKWQMKVVVIDTISRFIEGRENDADTWLAFYRCTGVHLKANKVALLRLDHMGKDSTRGGRGSSAKTQDVDHVYELSESSGRGPGKPLLLKRTFTRSGGGSEERSLVRVSKWDSERRLFLPGETKHLYQGEAITEAPLILPEIAPALPRLTVRASEMVDSLDRLNVSTEATFRISQAVLRGDGQTVGNNDLKTAVKFRKTRGPKIGQQGVPRSLNSTERQNPENGHSESDDNSTTPAVQATGTRPVQDSVHSDRYTTGTKTGTEESAQVSGTGTRPVQDRYTEEKSQAEGVPVRGARVSVPRPARPEGPESVTGDLDIWPEPPPPNSSDDAE